MPASAAVSGWWITFSVLFTFSRGSSSVGVFPSATWLHQLITVNWSLTTGSDWLLVALYVAIFGGVASILSFPLSYYSGFILPHRFDQSNQTLKDWIIDQLKGLAIGAPLGLILLELFYLALRATGRSVVVVGGRRHVGL